VLLNGEISTSALNFLSFIGSTRLSSLNAHGNEAKNALGGVMAQAPNRHYGMLGLSSNGVRRRQSSARSQAPFVRKSIAQLGEFIRIDLLHLVLHEKLHDWRE
jgi:hypothetical protein